MLRVKVILLTFVMVACQMMVAPSAEAGPLLDWLRNRRAKRSGCFQPTLPQTASYTGVANPYNLQPGQCARTCNQTCSRVVVNYVPCTSYRTNWKKVPVTQYRPETSSDPCTGCSVTCMKPCTTYTWQMQRVPYTTYRPVYRTENYTVPVTTITNDCATGTCATCPTNNCQTCPTPTYLGVQTAIPQSSSVITAPNGTLGTNGTFGSSIPNYNGGVPADSAPFIDPTVNPQNRQRPMIDRIETLPMDGSSKRTVPAKTPENNIYPINNERSTPAVINYGNQTAKSPVRKKWNYQVRQASYTSLVAEPAETKRGPIKIQGSYEFSQPVAKSQPVETGKANSAWKTVEW